MSRIFFIFLGLFLLFGNTFVQSAGNFTPFWHQGVDGVDILPEHHRLLHESSQMKVVDVFIAAHEAEKPHTHMLESFMFIDHPTRIVVRLVDEQNNEIVVFEQTEAQEVLAHPQYEQMSPEPLHYVSNIDDKDYRAIRVEVKNVEKSASRKKIEWNTPMENQELIEKTLWDLSIPQQEHSIITINDYEGVLIGNLDSRISVYVLIEGWELLTPCKYDASRPPVWILDSNQTYLIKNRTATKEVIYLLMIP